MYIFLVASELILLYFLSSHLTNVTYTFFLKLFHSRHTALGLITLLYLPGTIVHELSHWLTAEILRVPTGEISFTPDIDEVSKSTREIKMGEVQLGSTDPIRRFLIGIAPLINGLICIVALMHVWQYFWPQMDTQWLQIGLTGLFGYFIYAISNSMFLSKKDLEGAWMVYVIAGLIIFSIYIIGIRIEITGQVQLFLQQSIILLARVLAAVIGINLIILFIYSLLLHTVLKVSKT